ncbi:hypothetical protein ACH3Y9_13020 [Streptomyces sp. WSLK1-5]|uniref:hypothetical protein n=1 Tax=unclassified Streptomyces TaxID=2593676 RepID=UPI0037ABE220
MPQLTDEITTEVTELIGFDQYPAAEAPAPRNRKRACPPSSTRARGPALVDEVFDALDEQSQVSRALQRRPRARAVARSLAAVHEQR